ncbi:putative phospholipase A(2) [Medicago truncatula]|uniref:Patatin n=1 Tax=Medicago truncatula TaxID=3880 RepID=A0A396GA20_MEDTR|nr:putative phospholipase A(2) [Medicago truncatula]
MIMVIGGFNTKLPPPTYGNAITILNIDGGGIKGILPTVLLRNLEKALQNVSNDETAALADYFDVITGTSTGGLIAAMLTTPHPNDPSRPLLSPEQIKQFYLDFGPSIFNQTAARKWSPIISHFPKYDGKFLHEKAREILQETRLSDTLTNVVIPAFDILQVHPVIFSSFKVKKVPSLNAKLSDIAIGTSAAPTLLPAYNFTNGDNEFNLIDGALAASSPAFLAVNEVMQELEEKNYDFIPVNPNEPTKFVLLSLGCGRTGTPGHNTSVVNQYTATKWAPFLLSGLLEAARDIVEYNLESIFPSLQSSENYYLRIEEYSLDQTLTADNATIENMEKLIKAGEDLLEQRVKILNVTSFTHHEKPSELDTNAEALQGLAEILYKEQQLRLKTKSIMEKRGRPFVDAITSPLRMFGME